MVKPKPSDEEDHSSHYGAAGVPGRGPAGTDSWREVGHNIAGTVVSSQWLVLIFEVLWRNPWLVVWEIVTLGLALGVDKRLDARYSDFWHRDQLRLRLRKALGLG